MELPGHNIYGTYVFRRSDLDKCRPHVLIPSTKATILVRSSPVVYSLREDVEENFLGLPYRVIFAIMTVDTVILHDSQSRAPFMYVDNLHYDNLTSLCWTPDGKSMVVSSMEGYNTFIVLPSKLGTPTTIPEEVTGRTSPVLKKPKAPKAPKEGVENAEEPKKKKNKKDSEEETTPKKTPSAKQSTPKSTASQGTPSLLKFFAPVSSKRDGSPVSSKPTMVMASKSKKKIETVLLGDDE